MIRRILAGLRLLIVSLIFIVISAPEWPAFHDERHKLAAIVELQQFDYLVWEVNALLAKGNAWLGGGDDYLDEATRKQIVLDYLEQLRETQQLEREITQIFTDPAVTDPAEASQQQQQAVAEARADLLRMQPLAESIVQDQVASILVEEGFDIFGQPWPPVQMHMTPLPSILIISPRDEIRQKYAISLVHGLSTPVQEGLEEAVLEELNLSALVVPVGGIGLYPAMVVETTSINFLADVTAHEWAHHWLTLHPLGLNYAANPALRTVNETVASILGTEIGERVVARYYPEHVPLPPPPLAPVNPGPDDPDEPPPFNFRAEMAKTRIQVDELLAEGRIEEAEAHMEARRRFFVENGYRIRKLNQAYFAFYGAYADLPGATGGNPIGPLVQSLRAQSPSLRLFMDRVATVTSLEQLESLLITSSDVGVEGN